MQTTVNIRKELTHSFTEAVWPTCEHDIFREVSGGSNVEFGQRSKTVRNPKDEYGFRAMSPYKAEYHLRVQPEGTTVTTTDTSKCSPFQRSTGIPYGIERWFKPLLDRMGAIGEQSPDLLFMRAEAGLKQQDINVLQFAAFLPSTLKNIKDNLKKMDSLIDILHDPTAMKFYFKGSNLKSLYLQWLFVWNQLYRDVVGGAAFLKKQSRPIGSLVTGRSRAEWTTSFEDVAYPYAWSTIGKATCRTDVHVSQRAVSVARVTCDIAYKHNALGLDNPLYLMWDLLRWSWVIDQIVDVGLFIQSLTSLHGLEFLGTSLTTRITNTSQVNVEDYDNGGRPGRRWYGKANFKPGMSIRKTVNREVRSNPTHSITLRNPFQNNVAVTAAVAAALALKMQGDVDVVKILRHAR